MLFGVTVCVAELELEVCGSPEIDVDHLKANTTYSGCSPHDQHIKHFWTVLASFSQLERGQFLRFAWGRSRLPAGSKFTEKMRIDSTGNDITHLPQAHTCFFSIELPKVSLERGQSKDSKMARRVFARV